MSHNSPNPFPCSRCGKTLQGVTKFCPFCGVVVDPATPSTQKFELEDRLRGFHYRGTAKCSYCGYFGLMGWNKVQLPINQWLLIPLTFLGVLPAIICLIINLTKKRYPTYCPNCGTTTELAPSELKQIKGQFGIAQFYDADGVAVTFGRAVRMILGPPGKVIAIGGSAIVGLLMLGSLAIYGLQKLGLAPTEAQQKLVGKYDESESEFDGRNVRSLEVLNVTGKSLQFRLRVVGTAVGGAEVERGNLVGDAKLNGTTAQYRMEKDGCTVDLSFAGETAAVEQTGLCGFDLSGIASSTYAKVVPPSAATPVANIVQETTPAPTPEWDEYVKRVRGSVLQAPYNTTTIGQAFDGTFASGTWASEQSPKGVRFVQFIGKIKPEQYRDRFAANVDLFKKCIADHAENCKPPNEEAFSTVKVQFVLAADGASFTLGNYDVPLRVFPANTMETLMDYIYR